MAYTAKTPGKKGTITDALNMKNIGIDNKTFQLIDARIPMVQKMELHVGERVEYRIASQGDLTVKGKINFIGRDKDAPAAPPQTAPIQPFVPPVCAPAAEPKREPRIVQGQYLSKTGSSVTLKDAKGNAEAWAADLDLIVFLNKTDGKVKVGDMVKVQLIDNHGEWIAKLMGAFDPAIPEKPFKTAQEILKENLEQKQAETKSQDPAPVQGPAETITETEAADLIARGEAAKMEKIRTEAAMYSAQMKKENDARKAVEAPPAVPTTQLPKEPEICQQSEAVTVCEALPPTIKKTYSDDEMLLLRNVIAKGCSEPEFKLLMYMANTYGLDPLLKQIWAVKRNENTPALIFAGRDGMLAIAHRSGQFDGMQSAVVYDSDKKPVMAWCEVWRKDMTHSFKTEVPFSEYNTGFSVWKSNPSAMILKVAESVCLRKAFSVSGLYCPEEIKE